MRREVRAEARAATPARSVSRCRCLRVAARLAHAGGRDDLQHIDHDDRDVVAATVAERRLDELARGLLGLRVGDQEVPDAVGRELLREPVGADEQAHALLDGDRPVVGDRRLVESDGAGDHVGVRMRVGLLARDLPGVDELLHDGVVDRELLEHAADEAVDAGVADVEDDPRRLVGDRPERGAGDRRAAALVGDARAAAHVLHGELERRIDLGRADIGLPPCSASRVTTAALAKSPAAWPPMPSATAKIGACATKLSSLTSRRRPVSVIAAHAMVISVPSGSETRCRALPLPICVTGLPAVWSGSIGGEPPGAGRISMIVSSPRSRLVPGATTIDSPARMRRAPRRAAHDRAVGRSQVGRHEAGALDAGARGACRTRSRAARDGDELGATRRRRGDARGQRAPPDEHRAGDRMRRSTADAERGTSRVGATLPTCDRCVRATGRPLASPAGRRASAPSPSCARRARTPRATSRGHAGRPAGACGRRRRRRRTRRGRHPRRDRCARGATDRVGIGAASAVEAPVGAARRRRPLHGRRAQARPGVPTDRRLAEAVERGAAAVTRSATTAPNSARSHGRMPRASNRRVPPGESGPPRRRPAPPRSPRTGRLRATTRSRTTRRDRSRRAERGRRAIRWSSASSAAPCERGDARRPARALRSRR